MLTLVIIKNWIMNIVKFACALIFLSICGCEGQNPKPKILIINIRTLDRSQIAEAIKVVDSMDPSVISIDAIFNYDTEYEKDNRLIEALYYCDKVVMPKSIADYDGIQDEYLKFEGQSTEYIFKKKTGYSNVFFEKDDLNTLKKFSIWEIVKSNRIYHFAVRSAMEFDSLKTVDFIRKNPKIIEIDYKEGKRNFKVFEGSDVIMRNVPEGDFKGSIVLMGDLGQLDYDRFFTPLNNRKEPFEPDMYGVEVVANIVAQVLGQ